MLTDPFSRRSGDHGAFNQWDRLPYLSFEHDGINPSVKQAQNQLHHNPVVSNYVADAGCFDHDDGASFADMSNNFCVGGGHKNNVSSPFPQPKQHLRFRSLHSNAVPQRLPPHTPTFPHHTRNSMTDTASTRATTSTPSPSSTASAALASSRR